MDQSIATWPKRLTAYVIDTALLSFCAAFWSFGAIFVAWGYFTLLEASPWQATLGKKLMKLKVVTKEGKKLSLWHAFCRFPVAFTFCQVGWFVYFIDRSKRTLSDILTKTRMLDISR